MPLTPRRSQAASAHACPIRPGSVYSRPTPVLCQPSFSLGRAPALEVCNELVFCHTLGRKQGVKLRGSLLERCSIGLRTLAPGGYKVSDRISVPCDCDGRVAFQQVLREIFAKFPNAYGNGFHGLVLCTHLYTL